MSMKMSAQRTACDSLCETLRELYKSQHRTQSGPALFALPDSHPCLKYSYTGISNSIIDSNNKTTLFNLTHHHKEVLLALW